MSCQKDSALGSGMLSFIILLVEGEFEGVEPGVELPSRGLCGRASVLA
jgi:hypothetical protein